MMGLKGKVAIVTGAGSGIGLATSKILSSYAVSVVMTDINESVLSKVAMEMEGDVRVLRQDVSSQDDWAQVFAVVEDTFGHLDILVNNAGIMMCAPFEDASVDDLKRQYAVNVESVFMGMQGAIPLMRTSLAKGAKSCSIVNIASIYGMVGGAEFAAYSASKGAVRAMSKAVANELSKTGIRVNCVLPGPAATNLSADWEPPRNDEGRLLTPEEAIQPWIDLIPMGRIGQAEDIGPMIAFLCSDLASFATGAEFVVDGGYTAV